MRTRDQGEDGCRQRPVGPGRDHLAFSSVLLRHLHQVPLKLTKYGKSKSHRRASVRGCAQAKSPPPLQPAGSCPGCSGHSFRRPFTATWVSGPCVMWVGAAGLSVSSRSGPSPHWAPRPPCGLDLDVGTSSPLQPKSPCPPAPGPCVGRWQCQSQQQGPKASGPASLRLFSWRRPHPS